MTEDTSGLIADLNDESQSTSDTAETASDSGRVGDKWTTRYLWPFLNTLMLWIYRLVIGIVLTLVVFTSLTALVVGAITALGELGLWDSISQPGFVTELLGSIEYRTLVVAIGGFIAGYLFLQGQFRKTFGMWFRPQKDSRQLPIERLAKRQRTVIAKEALEDLAIRYTKAWCSQDAARVAAFFSTNGSLRVNDGPKAVGRAAIADVAQDFMTAFPDMQVLMNDLRIDNDRAVVYNWTLVGTNTGPGGSGKPINISGREVWKIGDDGLIAKSQGHFDKDDYQRQLGTEVE